MMGLFSKWVESLDYEYEILSFCTRFVSPRATCNQCIDSCTEAAITLVKGKPSIENDKCSECGYCISACPVQAIAGIYPRRTIIQDQLVIQGSQLPTAKELLILRKKGVHVIVAKTMELVESWKEPIDEANKILTQLEEKPFSLVIKSVEADQYYSRRELFSFWKSEGTSVLKQVAPAKWRFNHKDFDLLRYYKDFQFTSITVDLEKCTLCTACQKLCEKKCFDIQGDKFLILPQGCSSCQLCVDTCQEKAISVVDEISRATTIAHPIYERVCTSCRKTYKTVREHDEKCVACRKRENYFRR